METFTRRPSHYANDEVRTLRGSDTKKAPRNDQKDNGMGIETVDPSKTEGGIAVQSRKTKEETLHGSINGAVSRKCGLVPRA